MESVTYHTDTTWPQVQAFLPEANRLSPSCMPDEYYLQTYGEWQIHLDRYRPAVFAGASTGGTEEGEGTSASDADVLACEQEPKARVIAFHGIGGNGRLLSFLAVPLARAGYEVICPDLPLYGLTRYSGDIQYRDWVDVGETVVEHFADDQVPLFVMGLSAGGMLAYQVADRCNRTALAEGREPAVAGIIATCLLDQRDDHVTRWTAANPLLGSVAKPALEGLTPAMGSMPVPMMFMSRMRAIANDRNLVRLLLTDARSAGAIVPLTFVQTLLQPDLETEPEDFTYTPVLVAHPTRDRWCRPGLTKRFYQRLACPKMWIDLEGAGHLPIEPLGLAELETACTTFIDCFR
ncbi:MAG: alpha/beta hydrolase [Eggerthellaceae bacterium]|jgi:alpha-beta hydrolase superfamily lysophospholipase